MGMRFRKSKKIAPGVRLKHINRPEGFQENIQHQWPGDNNGRDPGYRAFLLNKYENGPDCCRIHLSGGACCRRGGFQ